MRFGKIEVQAVACHPRSVHSRQAGNVLRSSARTTGAGYTPRPARLPALDSLAHPLTIRSRRSALVPRSPTLRSSLLLVISALAAVVVGLVLFMRGAPSQPTASSSGGGNAAAEAAGHDSSPGLSAPADSRGSAVPIGQTAKPGAPAPKRSSAATSATPQPSDNRVQYSSDFADAPDGELDEAKLAEFFTTKYAGWTVAQRQAAIGDLKEAVRILDATPGEVKTHARDYAVLVSELTWLKEHQDP